VPGRLSPQWSDYCIGNTESEAETDQYPGSSDVQQTPWNCGERTDERTSPLLLRCRKGAVTTPGTDKRLAASAAVVASTVCDRRPGRKTISADRYGRPSRNLSDRENIHSVPAGPQPISRQLLHGRSASDLPKRPAVRMRAAGGLRG